MEMNAQTKIQYDALDGLKLILAVSIAVMHARFLSLERFLYPWLRLAVPLFFITSAYFFFVKLKSQSSVWRGLGAFVKRILFLYFGWSALLLPVSCFLRHKVWFVQGGWLVLLKDFVLGNFFSVGWFLIALVLSATIVVVLIRTVNKVVVYCLAFINYLLLFLFCHTACLPSFFSVYIKCLGWPTASVMMGFSWVVIGMALAEMGIDRLWIKKSLLVWSIAVSAFLLWFEWFVLCGRGNLTASCFFSLIPLATAVFLLALNLRVNLKNAKSYRKFSIVLYCMHFPILDCVRIAFPRIMSSQMVVHILAFFLCVAIPAVIYKVINRLASRYPIVKGLM